MQKLMIVDDDRTTVGLLKTLLELDGFEVITVADSDSAILEARNTKPDAFLVDYHLADKQGTDFVRRIRGEAEFKVTPIIMTSGLDRGPEAMAAGANRFLIKPFDPGDLLSELKNLIG